MQQIDANLLRIKEPKSLNSSKNTALSRFESTVAGFPGEVLSDQNDWELLRRPLNRQRLQDKSYKRECPETYLPVGSVPALCCLGIQKGTLS
jgi:hypothetical protein